MKYFYKLIFISLAGLLALPMFIKGSDGQPMMTIDDWIPDISGIEGKVDQVLAKVGELSTFFDDKADGSPLDTASSNSKEQKFYKWKDAEGVWQYSDKPNPAGENQTVSVNPDTNLVSSAGFTGAAAQTVEKKTRKSFIIKAPNPVTAIGQVPKLMDDIDGLQDQIDARARQLDGL